MTLSNRGGVPIVAAAGVLAGLACTVWARPQYELIDLGTLGNVSGPGSHLGPWWPVTAIQPDPARFVKNLDGSLAWGLNEDGQVAGIAAAIGAAGFDGQYATVPFRWDNGSMAELPSLAGPRARSAALAINDAGVAVGRLWNADLFGIQGISPVKWDPAQPGTYITLPSLYPVEPLDGAWAADINSAGQILLQHHRCFFCMGGDDWHTILIQANGQMTELFSPIPPGGGFIPPPDLQYTSGTALNDNGQVIGVAFDKPYVWENGQFQFPVWGHDQYIEVLDISNDGRVVGVANTTTEAYQMAALWEPPYTQPQILTPRAQYPFMDASWAHSINTGGEVVGSYFEPDGCPWCHRYRAFHWQNGQVTLLSDLIPFGSSFTALLHAYAINERGDIAGVGLTTDPDIIHAFLLKRVDDACYADCTKDGSLSIADFACFQAKFVAGDPYADCNKSGSLSIADFGCFQSAFAAGCP